MEDRGWRSQYKDLAFAIVNLSTMLDVLKIKDPHIILIGKNSYNWIVVYLTALIKSKLFTSLQIIVAILFCISVYLTNNE